MQWRISAEKAWTVIFALDLIEYTFIGVSLSDLKGIKIYHATLITNVLH